MRRPGARLEIIYRCFQELNSKPQRAQLILSVRLPELPVGERDAVALGAGARSKSSRVSPDRAEIPDALTMTLALPERCESRVRPAVRSSDSASTCPRVGRQQFRHVADTRGDEKSSADWFSESRRKNRRRLLNHPSD